MSSHHIVREDQEPALIIEDIYSIPVTLLNQLLEWSPVVITHHKNLTELVAMGIKVDVLITDTQPDLPQDHIRVEPFTGSFLDTALTYLINKSYRAANILSNDAAAGILLSNISRITITLLGNGKRMFPAKSGFRKWKAKNEPILINEHSSVSAFTGLIQQGPYTYLTKKDGFYTFRFNQPYGIISEQL